MTLMSKYASDRIAIRGSMRNTTTKDGGSAKMAWSKFLPRSFLNLNRTATMAHCEIQPPWMGGSVKIVWNKFIPVLP